MVVCVTILLQAMVQSLCPCCRMGEEGEVEEVLALWMVLVAETAAVEAVLSVLTVVVVAASVPVRLAVVVLSMPVVEDFAAQGPPQLDNSDTLTSLKRTVVLRLTRWTLTTRPTTPGLPMLRCPRPLARLET